MSELICKDLLVCFKLKCVLDLKNYKLNDSDPLFFSAQILLISYFARMFQLIASFLKMLSVFCSSKVDFVILSFKLIYLKLVSKVLVFKHVDYMTTQLVKQNISLSICKYKFIIKNIKVTNFWEFKINFLFNILNVVV